MWKNHDCYIGKKKNNKSIWKPWWFTDRVKYKLKKRKWNNEREFQNCMFKELSGMVIIKMYHVRHFIV